MADQATENISVAAPPERCFAVAADLEHYPEWAADIKEVEVKERDDLGRPLLVTFRAAAFGRSTSYTLAYDYAEAPRVLAWKLTQGDITTKLDGSYIFDPGEGGGTDVTYHLEAELRVPIPGFIKMRATSRIMATAMRELKARVESDLVTPDGGQAAAGVTYGIDIGGTKVLGVALDRADDIVAEARVATPKGTRNIVGSHVAEAVAEVVAGLDRASTASTGRGAVPRAPVGVGAPGMVDHEGRLRFAPNLPQAQGVDWNELMGEQLPGRTRADRERRQLRRAGRAAAGCGPGLRRRRHGHAGDRHRRRTHDRRARAGRRRRASPARSATWWWTRTAPRAPAAGAAAGSASPRAPGSACWPARPPWRGGWARWSGGRGATPRACGARTSPPRRRPATRRRSR